MKLKKYASEFIKNNSKDLFIAIIVVLCTGTLYCILPRLLMDKPHIHDLTPSVVMANSKFNDQKSITINGTGFDHIIGIYINGVWEPECTILSSTTETVNLILPGSYYTEGNSLAIQIQTKVNSDLTALSNKASFEVLSDEIIETPEIVEIYPAVLQYDNNLIQKICLKGTYFNEDSVVLIDNIAAATTYSDGCLFAEIPFYTWCMQNSVILKVAQYYDGYPTSIVSTGYYMKTEQLLPEADDTAESRTMLNAQLMINYLNALQNNNYLIVFAARDEASYAITKEIEAALNRLGLRKSLEGKFRCSYIAAIDEQDVIVERLSSNALIYDETIDDIAIHIESAGGDTGNYSSIKIKDEEYSVNARGLNIVVYDKSTDEVVSSVCFDLYDEITLYQMR